MKILADYGASFGYLTQGKLWKAFLSAFSPLGGWLWPVFLLGTGLAVYLKTQSLRAVYILLGLSILFGAPYMPATAMAVLTGAFVVLSAYLLWQVIR